MEVGGGREPRAIITEQARGGSQLDTTQSYDKKKKVRQSCDPVDQLCSIELSRMMEILYICAARYSSHTWVLST